ncbi:MAG: hypothetical protein H0X71_02845 [Rubrobacter sp.]|nr:hypothetical protein [Rubrobacter sp.]
MAVIEVLPAGVRPVVLADWGFRRAGFLSWPQLHGIDYVVRLSKGSCITEADGKQWKLGEEGLERGQLRWVRGVRYGLYHGRPGDLFVNVALCWRIPKSRERALVPGHEPEGRSKSIVSWYWQRGWIEQSFKDSKGRSFGLAEVMVGCYKRFSRLLMALMVALAWLKLMGLPEVGVMPRCWPSAMAQRGRASVISLALEFGVTGQTREHTALLPASILAGWVGGYA